MSQAPDKKPRRYPPDDEIAAIRHAADNTCCKCRESGRRTQLHHIDSDCSNADPDNFAVLCLNCHDETMITGGFGRKLDAGLVRKYRDDWNEFVGTRRQREQQDRDRRGATPPSFALIEAGEHIHLERNHSDAPVFLHTRGGRHITAQENTHSPRAVRQSSPSTEPPSRRTGAEPARNAPCPCGSGMKYKKCCGASPNRP